MCKYIWNGVKFFLSKSGSSVNVFNISRAMSIRCCCCLKFSNFGPGSTAARFIPKTSVKLAWHEPKDMPQHHQQPLFNSYSTIIQNHFLHCFNVFIGCWWARATFLKPIIPQLNLCSTHSRLAKRHSQHFICPCTLNFTYLHKI